MPLYDRIGSSYASTRAADPRIVDTLEALLALPSGSVIADLGAGTGTYTYALASRGLQLIAVEPSAVMRDQAVPHPRVQWKQGSAEAIPLPDGSVDGVLSTLAVHHFHDLSRAMEEIVRVCRGGPVVFFTFDPSLHPEFWLYEYFPFLRESALRHYPPAERIGEALRACGCHSVSVMEFPLSRHPKDRFAAAGWAEPEIYLDPGVRANMSPFRLMPENLTEDGALRLRRDLDSGVWEAKYGHLKGLTELPVGYLFVRANTPIIQPRAQPANAGDDPAP